MANKRSPATAGTVDRENRYSETAGRYAPVDEKARPRPPAPWFRFWVEKWFTMTRNLGPVEVAALVAIMAEVHQRGEPYPEDHARLAKRCRTTKPAMSRAIEALVEEQLLVRQGGGLWSAYIGDEIDHRGKRAEVAAQNVNKRWGKTERNQSASATKAHKSLEARGIEGNGPTGDHSPSLSSSTTEGVGSALGSASLPGRSYTKGDRISVPGRGWCTLVDEPYANGSLLVVAENSDHMIVTINDCSQVVTVEPFERSDDEDLSWMDEPYDGGEDV